jgi:hypothetical protein
MTYRAAFITENYSNVFKACSEHTEINHKIKSQFSLRCTYFVTYATSDWSNILDKSTDIKCFIERWLFSAQLNLKLNMEWTTNGSCLLCHTGSLNLCEEQDQWTWLSHV